MLLVLLVRVFSTRHRRQGRGADAGDAGVEGDAVGLCAMRAVRLQVQGCRGNVPGRVCAIPCRCSNSSRGLLTRLVVVQAAVVEVEEAVVERWTERTASI